MIIIIVGFLAFVMPAMLTGSGSNKSTVTSLSLGVEVNDGEFSIIIPKNTPIPAKRTKTYITYMHYQTSVRIAVYEGDDALVKNNNLLDEFELAGIPSKEIGEEKLEETIEVEEEFIRVTATVRSNGAISKSITIKRKLN